MVSKKDTFKELFYTNLTESEIKQRLGLDYKEYRLLLGDVKRELGLPSSYRRRPQQYGHYDKDSYYILKKSCNDFEIIGYYPVMSVALEVLDTIKGDVGFTYKVDKASDDNLKAIIVFGYITLKYNWEKIMGRMQLPYHKFYSLLNLVKKEHHISNNNPYRFVYKTGNGYIVRRNVKGRVLGFGNYTNRRVACLVRDYVESIGWDVDVWEENKSEVLDRIGL